MKRSHSDDLRSAYWAIDQGAGWVWRVECGRERPMRDVNAKNFQAEVLDCTIPTVVVIWGVG